MNVFIYNECIHFHKYIHVGHAHEYIHLYNLVPPLPRCEEERGSRATQMNMSRWLGKRRHEAERERVIAQWHDAVPQAVRGYVGLEATLV